MQGLISLLEGINDAPSAQGDSRMSDFDLGQLVTDEMLSEGGMSALGGVVGGASFALATDLLRRDAEAEDVGADGQLPAGTALTKADGTPVRVPMLGTPGRKMIAAGVLGLVGGRLAWMWNEDVAKGHVGYMVGQVTDGLYDMLMGKRTLRVSNETLGENDEAAAKAGNALQLNGAGFAGALRGASFSGGGFNDAEIFEERPGGVFADVEVEPEDDDMLGTIDAVSSYGY